jgi:hypothetical protein
MIGFWSSYTFPLLLINNIINIIIISSNSSSSSNSSISIIFLVRVEIHHTNPYRPTDLSYTLK